MVEIEQLKQQLAESETDLSLARNEIDTLKHNIKIVQEHDNVMCEQYFNKCKEHQDKIDFAVERLKKDLLVAIYQNIEKGRKRNYENECL